MNNYEAAERLFWFGHDHLMRAEFVEAQESFKQAIKQDPTSKELYYNLAKAYAFNDQFTEALDALYTSIEIDPKFAEAYALIGSCKMAVNEPEEASEAFGVAYDWAELKNNAQPYLAAKAFAELIQGNFVHGFKLFQHRGKPPETWDGSQDLRGKSLLVVGEGGLGDQIFYGRYVDFLSSLDATVEYAVDERLVEWFEWHVEKVDTGQSREDFDYYVNMGSLPYIFNTQLGTIPQYQTARTRARPYKSRIGLAWSGNPAYLDDRNRSIPFEIFSELLAFPADWFTLQKDVRYTDVEAFERVQAGTNPKHRLRRQDFENVAHMAETIRTTDLVITVDTMTAHLAGAEGIPTWLLLPYACDWRWGLNETTPWYPSIKIFRQGADREWAPVIQRVLEELRA